MRRMKAIAKPLAPNHELAAELWASGLYEARTIAALIDDASAVDVEQMNAWCRDFDNWAIVDTVCFHLFDKSPYAWEMLEPWTSDDREFVKRAGFALLWALALHDNDATDQQFADALNLVERHADDGRHLVTKSQIMALRAIGKKRPEVRPNVVDLARRLANSDTNARKVGRPITKAFEET